MDEITEFLEICITMIIFNRSLYPASLFTQKRAYGIPVRQSRHPLLTEYIKSIVRPSSISQVMIVISDQNIPLEKYTISLLALDYNDTEDLTSYFRAFLLKVMSLDSTLDPLPSTSTWLAYIETDEIPEDFIEHYNSADVKINGSVLPLRSMETARLRMELVVEESSQKKSVTNLYT